MADKNETTTAKAVERVSKSVENFTKDFHKSLAGKTEGNFVSSALSAHTMLAMAAYGAAGSTAKAMRKCLHMPTDDSQALQEFQRFVDDLNNVPNVVLILANKIYAAQNLEVQDKFKNIMDKYFRSESEKVDFKNNFETVQLIKKWCVEKTEGKIDEILKSDDINENERMLLLNPVYFKGDWKNKFNPENTKPRPFYVDKNTTINVPTMYIKEEFFYTELDEVDAKAVALPYVNEDLFMVIIVPNEINGLEKVEKNLEKIDLNYEHCKYRRTKVHLYLPKLKVESTHNLKGHLSELGMSEMFSRTANFKGICGENVRVSKVIQKAFIEVNEEGGEAAPVTGMRLMKRCLPPPPVELQINRPYLFKIVDIKRNVTFFSGRIIRPDAS